MNYDKKASLFLISAAEDEITFDPGDVITNIEMVRGYFVFRI